MYTCIYIYTYIYIADTFTMYKGTLRPKEAVIAP